MRNNKQQELAPSAHFFLVEVPMRETDTISVYLSSQLSTALCTAPFVASPINIILEIVVV